MTLLLVVGRGKLLPGLLRVGIQLHPWQCSVLRKGRPSVSSRLLPVLIGEVQETFPVLDSQGVHTGSAMIAGSPTESLEDRRGLLQGQAFALGVGP